MTGFNSQVGGGIYRIQIETDRSEVFNTIQMVARSFIDTEQTRKVVVSQKEKTTGTEESSVCYGVCEENKGDGKNEN